MTEDTKPIKTAYHHWWPTVVSKRWLNSENKVHQILCNQKTITHKVTNKANFGSRKDAHTIKISTSPSFWDVCYENEFDKADTSFPEILDWLNSVHPQEPVKNISFKNRFHTIETTEDQHNDLMECILSLVIRSPRFRDSIDREIRSYQGETFFPRPPSNETLIKVNQRYTFQTFKDNLQGRGKFVILVSKDREFIFGDGFYQNYNSSSHPPIHPQIIVPLTPHRCVFYTRPQFCFTEPETVTMTLTNEETDFINLTTQIYSCNELFYKSQKPNLEDAFTQKKFFVYENTPPFIKEMEAAIY